MIAPEISWPNRKLGEGSPQTLRVVAWEITRACNLGCVHCRAAAAKSPPPGELSTAESFRLLEEIAARARPLLILTGGEPLLRSDLFEIAGHASKLGLRVALAVNGTLLTEDNARRALDVGIRRVSVSIDGPSAQVHDSFRQFPGAFAGAMRGIAAAKTAGLPFQVNTTVTRHNVDALPQIMKLAERSGAVAFHIFLLVPAGRGRRIPEESLSPERCEEMLLWFAQQEGGAAMDLKVTCAPHYARIRRQMHLHLSPAQERDSSACIAGRGFCFISHVGTLQPCGYLELNCGSVRERGFWELWERAPVFRALREGLSLRGRCGHCEFVTVCGGCRARAYGLTGDLLGEEPLCAYDPDSSRPRASHERELE